MATKIRSKTAKTLKRRTLEEVRAIIADNYEYASEDDCDEINLGGNGVNTCEACHVLRWVLDVIDGRQYE